MDPGVEQRLAALEERHAQQIDALQTALNDLKRDVSDLKAVIINRHEDRSTIVLKLNDLDRKVNAIERASVSSAGRKYLNQVVRAAGRLLRKRKRGGAR